MTTTEAPATRNAPHATRKNAGIRLAPEAREFTVDPMFQTSVVTSVAYGNLIGSDADFKTADGELAIDGAKPKDGYPADALFFLNIKYGDEQRLGSDGITFEDFEAVVIAMQDLHATAIANDLSASPGMRAFNPSQRRAR